MPTVPCIDCTRESRVPSYQNHIMVSRLWSCCLARICRFEKTGDRRLCPRKTSFHSFKMLLFIHAYRLVTYTLVYWPPRIISWIILVWGFFLFPTKKSKILNKITRSSKFRLHQEISIIVLRIFYRITSGKQFIPFRHSILMNQFCLKYLVDQTHQFLCFDQFNQYSPLNKYLNYLDLNQFDRSIISNF